MIENYIYCKVLRSNYSIEHSRIQREIIRRHKSSRTQTHSQVDSYYIFKDSYWLHGLDTTAWFQVRRARGGGAGTSHRNMVSKGERNASIPRIIAFLTHNYQSTIL